MGSLDVTVVTAMRGRSDLTLQLIEGLRRHEGESIPVIVVDDGSPAESDRQAIRELCDPQVSLICRQATGVTAAWNRGIELVKTGSLVLLNNDVRIDGPILERLIGPIVRKRHRLVGVRQRTERMLPAALMKRLGARCFLEGWCLALDRATWASVGGFDESMSLYWSDTDFQLRVRQCWPGASFGVVAIAATHEHGATARGRLDRRAQWKADRTRFIQKWSPPVTGTP